MKCLLIGCPLKKRSFERITGGASVLTARTVCLGWIDRTLMGAVYSSRQFGIHPQGQYADWKIQGLIDDTGISFITSCRSKSRKLISVWTLSFWLKGINYFHIDWPHYLKLEPVEQHVTERERQPNTALLKDLFHICCPQHCHENCPRCCSRPFPPHKHQAKRISFESL